MITVTTTTTNNVTTKSYKFGKPAATISDYLYCTNTNNGVRVGTNTNNSFTYVTGGTANNVTQADYLFNTATSRYVGIYNKQDWRCYNTTPASGNNISNQSFTFYKRVQVVTQDPYIEADDVEIAYNATSGSIEYSIENGNGNITAEVTSGDWITEIGTITETEVPFTCSANTTHTARTATVTLTFGQTVTKEVIVTQAAVPYTTITDLFNDAPTTATDVTITFGGWVVSGVNGNNAYLTDNQGNGLIIYQSNHGFVANDVLTGTASCQLVKYKGAAELKGLTAGTSGLSVAHNGTVTEQSFSISELAGVNTGAVVNLGVLKWTGSAFKDSNNNEIVYYSTFYSQSFTTNQNYNVKGVFIYFSDNSNPKEIAPRDANDITVVTTYTVTYDGNGADGGITPTDNTQYTSGQTVTVLANTFTKTGHTFEWWSDMQDWNTQGAHIYDPTDNTANTFSITANTTLYAQWSVNSYDYTLTVTGEDEAAMVALYIDGNEYTSTSGTIEYGKEVTVSALVSDGYTYSIAVKDANNQDVLLENEAFVMPASAVTITVTTEVAQSRTITFISGSGSCSTTSMSGYDGASITLPTATPSEVCYSVGWRFAGWATSAVTETTTAPTLLNGSYTINGDATLYAVYSLTEGSVFDNTAGGNFMIYAAVTSDSKTVTNYYATGTGKKLSSVTDEDDATVYTFEKLEGENYGDHDYAIKTGSTYIKYSSSTDLGTDTNPYAWTIEEDGTNGTWRIKSKETTARGIVFQLYSTNGTTSTYYYQFGGYAVSNVDGAQYFDVEIGGGTTTYDSNPRCSLPAPTVYSIAASDGDEENHIYFFEGNAFDVTISPATGLTMKYTVDGTDPKTSETATPVTNGEDVELNFTTDVVVKAVSVSGENFSEVVTYTFHKLTSIASVRAGVGSGNYYYLKGVVTYQTSSEIVLQDETGGIETYRGNGYFADVNVGDEVILHGKPAYYLNNTSIELAVDVELITIVSSENTVVPVELTLAQLAADDELSALNAQYQCVLVKVVGAEAYTRNYGTDQSPVSGIALTQNGTERTIKQELMDNVTSIGIAAGDMVNVVAVNMPHNNYALWPRTAADITEYVVDFAELPFYWAGGVLSGFNGLTGTSYSLNDQGSYAESNAPYRIKFTNTGDYLQVKTDCSPSKVIIGVKMIGGGTSSTITVKASVDGLNFDNGQALTISGSQNSIQTLTTTRSFDANVRYIRLVFTKGSNVGVGPICIAKTATFTKEIVGFGDDNKVKTGWYLIASPVAVDIITNTMVTGNYDLYRFNEHAAVNPETGIAREWENYKVHNTDTENPFNTLVSGQGYLYARSQDIDLQFTGDYTGINKVILSKTTGVQFAGMNLVGNPFDVTAYPDCGSFYVMNAAGSGIEVAERNYVNPMEGIFVEAANDGDELVFSTVAPTDSPSPALTLNVSQTVSNRGNVSTANIDRAIVRFGEGRQLSKFILFENSTKLYIPLDGKDFAVVRTEAQGTMPVNFRANENGEYTLTVNPENVEMNYLHLIDNMTGADVDLLANPSYSFNAKVTDYESRFKLVFASANQNGEEGNDNFAFFSNGQLIIANEGQATLQVIDITGRILSSESINGSVSKSLNAPAGIYMLRLVNGDNVKVQKMVIR